MPGPKASLAAAQAAGLATPQPSDFIHRGDDAITLNARFTVDALTTAEAAAAEAATRAAATEALQVTGDPDAVFSVVDEDNRRTWLEAARDGGPTALSAEKISTAVGPSISATVGLADMDTDVNRLSVAIVDEDDRRTWLEATEAGTPSARALRLIADGLGGVELAATGPVFPSADWAHWGDSLTAAGWPATLAGMTGRTHYNGGWGGQNTDQIAARQGGVPARLTLAGNALPATGPASVTAITRGPLSAGGTRRGSILGVAGTLARDTVGAYTFTRDTEGAGPTAVAPGTVFTPEDGDTRRDRTVTIWTGRNGFKGTDPMLIVQSVQQMIDYLSPAVRRVIVMEVPPWEGEENGVGFRPQLDTLNAELRAAFRPYWLPIATWLRTDDAAAAAGVTFTADDRTDIANGITPRSLRSDGGHLNTAGNLAIAKRVLTEAQNRGWI